MAGINVISVFSLSYYPGLSRIIHWVLVVRGKPAIDMGAPSAF